MTPLGNRIYILPVSEETRRGFLIPETYRDPRVGVVTHVGTGKKTKKGVHVPISINVGDKVCVPDHSKRYIELDGKTHWVIDADNVLCVLE